MKHWIRLLCLSLLSIVVGAASAQNVAMIGSTGYATLQAAVDAAQESGGAQTITLIANVSGETVTIQEVANFKLTIDGQNKTVDAVIVIDGLRGNGGSNTNGASVTIQNIAFVNSSSSDLIKPQHYPHHLTIQDCTYTGSAANINKWFINVSDAPLYNATIKNVTVENSRLIQASLGLDVVFENITAINNCTAGFNIKTEGTVLIKNCQITTAKYAFRDMVEEYVGTITLEDNTFISTSTGSDEGAIVDRGGKVGTGHINVISGTYTGPIKVLNNKEGVLAISGGYFSEEFPQEYITADLVAQGKVCAPATDKEGYFTIGDPHYVAQIGETKYVSLQSAVDAAQQIGGAVTVNIIDDISGETVTIKEVANFQLTIDGQKDASSNYTVDAVIVVDGLRGNGGSTTNGASVTLQNIAFVKTTATDGIQASHYPHHLTIQDCTYSGSDNDKWFLNASVDGPLYGVTVKDVTVEHARLIYANMADDAVFQNITATNDVKVGFNVKTSGTALIENCQVTTGKYAFRDYTDAYEGTFTLKDNIFISTSEASDEGVIVNRGGTVGTAHVNVESGTYTGHVKVLNSKEGVLAISGGYFSEEFPQEYIAADLVAQGKVCAPATDKEGYFTIGDPHYVAQIGETKYVSLQAALDAAHEMTGDVTITLLDDISNYSIVHQKAGLNLTIDGADKKVTSNIIVDGDGRGTGTETLTIQNIKFEGDGTDFCSGTSSFVEVPSCKTEGTPYYTNKYNYAHNITVTNCSFTSTTSGLTMAAIRSNSGAGAYNVVISDCTGTNLHSLAQLTGTTGGSITGNTVSGSESFVNVNGGAGDFTISGNTFTSAEGADGYGIRENGSSTAVITLTDNTFTATNAVVLGKGSSVTAGTINVISGTYVGDIVKTDAATGKIVISGGHFSAPLGNEAYADFIAEGYIGMNDIYSDDEAAPNGVVSSDMAVMYTAANGKVTFSKTIPNAFSTGTYKLLKDITCSTRMTPGILASDVTLDLNGHTLTSTATDCAILLSRSGSSSKPKIFNLIDTSDEKGGILKVNPAVNIGIEVSGSYNQVTIGEGVTIDGDCVALLGSNQTLTVNGTINGGNDFAVATNGSSTKNATIIVNEGAVLTSDVAAMYLPGNEGLTATINGGTITGGNTGIELRAGQLVVNGGDITSTATEYSYTPNGSGTTTKGAAIAVVQHTTLLPIDAQILGGTLTGLNQIAVVDAQDNDLEGVSVKAKDDLIVTTTIPEDFKWASNGDGTSSLVPKTYVAQIGEGEAAVKYETLEEAFAAAVDGSTIKLLANTSGNGIIAPEGKFNTNGLTVDFAGFTYDVTGNLVGSSGTESQGFQLLKDNKITFKNGTVKSTDNAIFLVQNYSDLTLEDMTLTLSHSSRNDCYTLSNNNGTIVIDGTTINANEGGSFAFDVCRYAGYPSVSVTITGESVINGDVEVSASGSDAKNGFYLMLDSGTINGDLVIDATAAAAMEATPDKAIIREKDSFGQAAPADFKWVSDGEGTGTSTLKAREYIAAIGTTKYETLQEAVDAAGTAATTITLLTEAATNGVISGDGVVVPSGSNITFDLNGLTYDVAGETVGSSGTETLGFQLLQNSDITFKNGTLKATAPTAQMLIQNYSNLTLEDVNLDGTTLSGWAYALSNNCGTINLTGSTSITAKTGGRAFDTCKFGSYAIPTVNVNTTGAITGPIEATGGKLIIENGKFNVTWVTDNNYSAGDIQIKGGIFSEEPAEEYLVEGYVTTENEDDETKAAYPYAVMTKEDAGIFEIFDLANKKTVYDRTTNVIAKELTYHREFVPKTAGNLQPWFVPFDYTVTEEDIEKFTFYKINLIAPTKAAGEVENENDVYLFYKSVEPETVLHANKPYLVRPKEAGTYDFKLNNVELKACVTEAALSVSTARFNYDFYGTYDKFGPTQEGHQWLSINVNGNLFWNIKNQSYVNNYRWYVWVTSNYGDNDYANINFIFVEGDGETTTIDRLIYDPNAEIEGFYTVGGIKLDKPVRGLNIVKYTDGRTKKVYVK